MASGALPQCCGGLGHPCLILYLLVVIPKTPSQVVRNPNRAIDTTARDSPGAFNDGYFPSTAVRRQCLLQWYTYVTPYNYSSKEGAHSLSTEVSGRVLEVTVSFSVDVDVKWKPTNTFRKVWRLLACFLVPSQGRL